MRTKIFEQGTNQISSRAYPSPCVETSLCTGMYVKYVSGPSQLCGRPSRSDSLRDQNVAAASKSKAYYILY
jgi:hypothetical protein